MSAADIARDALFGNPPSATRQPSREGILAAFVEVDKVAGAALAGIIYYPTGTARAADTARPVGTIGKAADEADFYRRTADGWVVDNSVYQGVASVVQPIVDDALAQVEQVGITATQAQISPYQPAATYQGPLTRDQLRGFLLDVDLSDWAGYNPARLYSFAIITKSATAVTLELYEQTTPGAYTPPVTPRLTFTASTSTGYDPASKAVLFLTSTTGVGRVAIVPAAIPSSDTARTAMDYGRAGLDAHVFQKGYGLFARLGGTDPATADPDTGQLAGAYPASGNIIHPQDATEHPGDAVLQFPGVGQYQVIDRDIAIVRVGTGIFSAFDTPFKGRIEVRLHSSVATITTPTAGRLIQTVTYPLAVYSNDLVIMLDQPTLARAGQCLAVYGIGDSGYKAGMRYWDHPRAGQSNPTGRTPLLFENGGGWGLGSVLADQAYYQVPPRIYTSIPSRAEFEALAALVDQQEMVTDDSHLLGASNLREFARYRAMLLASVPSTVLHVAFAPADSYTEDDEWVARLARQWKAEMGDGGAGWTGVGFPSGSNGASNAQKAADATGNVDPAVMTIAFSGPGWTGEYTRVIDSPDLCAATSSTVGDRITFTYAGPGNQKLVRVHYFGGSGVCRYRWNGGAWTTLNLSGSNGQSVALTGAPDGAWTLEIEVVSGTCKIFGIVALTGTNGVVVHDLANNGSALCNWARMNEATPVADRARIAAAWERLGPVRTVISPIGPNDQGQQWTYVQFGNALDLVLDEMVRVAWPGADYLHVAAPENGRDTGTFPYRMALYAAEAKKRVASKGIAVLDMQPLFGADYAAYGDEGTDRQLFDPDKLHPNLAGGFVYGPTIDTALRYRS